LSIMFEIVDHNKLFQSLSVDPLFINDFDLKTEEDRKRLDSRLFTRYEGDSPLDVLPRCQCGHLTGGRFTGMICPECGYQCLVVSERNIESDMWMAPPEGVRAFINPLIWVIFSKYMTHSGFNVLEYLVNPYYKANRYPEQIMERLRRADIPRGINFFHDNFDKIFEILMKERLLNIRKDEKADLIQFVNENRPAIFSKYLPIPNKMSFVAEDTSVGFFMDTQMATPAFAAFRTISGAVNSVRPLSLDVLQSRAVKANVLMTQYYMAFHGKPFGAREGWSRKHIFGSRLFFSARAVISSLSENHHYEEAHLPWSLAVVGYKLHIQNKLKRLGMTPKEAARYINDHTLRYDPLIDSIFKELIEESPHGGLPIILQRNPTLDRLSAQRFLVTKIKTNVRDVTISMSVLTLVGPNADYDGDALNVILILDKDMYDKLQRLSPHLGVLDLMAPRTISNNVKLPGPVVSTIADWLSRA